MLQLQDFVGNERVVSLLKNAFQSGRLPHAVIFHGLDGVGKRTLTRTIATLLFCEQRNGFDFCGVCKSCNLLRSGNHPDLHLLKVEEGHKEILIDSVRDLISEMQKTPYMAPVKAVIIESPELMSMEASNALLKVLEEPPGEAHIFLITSRVDSLMQTIKSRCQILKFGSVPSDDISRILSERKGFSPEEAGNIARIVSGSIGKALVFADEDWGALRNLLDLFSRIFVDNDPTAMAELSDLSEKGRSEFDEMLKNCYIICRDVLCASLNGEGVFYIEGQKSNLLGAVAREVSIEKLLDFLDTFDRFYEVNRQNLNLKINAQYFVTKLKEIRIE